MNSLVYDSTTFGSRQRRAALHCVKGLQHFLRLTAGSLSENSLQAQKTTKYDKYR
jgi:hypothetical protein